MKTITLGVVQRVTDSGELWREEYWLNGNLHNEHGAAYREWDESGELIEESYWLNGESLLKAEWERKVNPDPCLGKVITVDGKQYRLGEV